MNQFSAIFSGTKMRASMAIVFVIILFIAVYAPAFAVVGRHPDLITAVPTIIVITFLLSCILMLLLTRRWSGFKEYGFRLSDARYLVVAVLIAVPVGLLLTYVNQKITTTSEFSGTHFAPWMLVVYFLIAAPIQEETIFRGLLQTTLAKRFDPVFKIAGHALSVPTMIIALLFGLVHLQVSMFTAFSAFILSLLAGELRQRSGSLLPAFLAHAIFNAAGILWSVLR